MPGRRPSQALLAVRVSPAKGEPMRKQRDQESGSDRSERLDKKARDRKDDALSEDKAMDAAVKRSIDLHGA